jgi:arsenite methyltransferase
MALRRGNYGYDAPYALIAFAGVATLATILAVASWMTEQRQFFRIAAGYAGFFGLNAASFFYTTRYGKFLMWEGIVDRLNFDGGEQVLDMGCGRGAVLIAVARRLTTGKVTGVDLWRSIDQSGNSVDATLANARAEGVADRVVLETGDMRKLPFADNTFDVIVSSLAIHNIPAPADRAAAITEAIRVLKPGGRLAIADIRTTALYARTLESLGANAIVRRRLGWRFWYGNPFAATSLVTARKAL